MPLTQSVEPITVAARLPSLWARDGAFIEFKANIVQLRAPLVFSRNSRDDLCHPPGGFEVWFRSTLGARWSSRFHTIGGGLRRLSPFRFGRLHTVTPFAAAFAQLASLRLRTFLSIRPSQYCLR